MTKVVIRACHGFTFEDAVNSVGNAFGSLVLSAPIAPQRKIQTLENLTSSVVATLIELHEKARDDDNQQ